MDGRNTNLNQPCCPEIGPGGNPDNIARPGLDTLDTYDKWTSWTLDVNRITGQITTTVRDRDGGSPVQIDDGTWSIPVIPGKFNTIVLFVDTRDTTSFLIDNIRIVPEPAGFALMTLGMLGLGRCLRQSGRKKSSPRQGSGQQA